jgi:hypothetical protein
LNFLHTFNASFEAKTPNCDAFDTYFNRSVCNTCDGSTLLTGEGNCVDSTAASSASSISNVKDCVALTDDLNDDCLSCASGFFKFKTTATNINYTAIRAARTVDPSINYKEPALCFSQADYDTLLVTNTGLSLESEITAFGDQRTSHEMTDISSTGCRYMSEGFCFQCANPKHVRVVQDFTPTEICIPEEECTANASR